MGIFVFLLLLSSANAWTQYWLVCSHDGPDWSNLDMALLVCSVHGTDRMIPDCCDPPDTVLAGV